MYWARPLQPVVEVWRRLLTDANRLTARAKERLRQSQLLESDPPVKVVEERGQMCLVQSVDLTLGFVECTQLEKIPPGDYWADAKRFGAEPVNMRLSESQFQTMLKNWPASKYVWGGRAPAGMDCSAMVQAVMLKAAGAWLPKHSRNQAALGQDAGTVSTGDIVLMEDLKRGVSHIGIVADAGHDLVWHHARHHGRPVFETLSELKSRYRILAVRHLINFHD